MDQVQQDLLSDMQSNNTTSAYEKTGIYPFNPKCLAWTEAIESIGQTSTIHRDARQKVRYEFVPNGRTDLVVLSADNKVFSEVTEALC